MAGNFGDGLGSQDVGKNLLLAAHGSNLEPQPPPVHGIGNFVELLLLERRSPTFRRLLKI